jgi:hypothetical protein
VENIQLNQGGDSIVPPGLICGSPEPPTRALPLPARPDRACFRAAVVYSSAARARAPASWLSQEKSVVMWVCRCVCLSVTVPLFHSRRLLLLLLLLLYTVLLYSRYYPALWTVRLMMMMMTMVPRGADDDAAWAGGSPDHNSLSSARP